MAINMRRHSPAAPVVAVAAMMAWSVPGQARVASIVVDSAAAAFGGVAIGAAGAYETVTGRVFGEIDPLDAHNTIIQDLDLAARNANRRVPYIATFQLTKPVSMSLATGLLFYDVPNRGGNAIPDATSIVPGAAYLQSGWQGDLLARCTSAYPCTDLSRTPAGTQQLLQVPVARNPDGSSITGPVYGHIANAGGSTAQMVIYTTPIPYEPASLDTTRTTLYSFASQTITGVDDPKTSIASGDWAWADCRTTPFPGTPDPTRICLKNGFDPSLLYEMVFTAKDPLVLGVGYAATRDIISFFHHARADDGGTPNPIAGAISKVVSVGVSQSASFIRSSIHLGFNQDESGRQVVDGAWPQIDGRQLYMNVRFALPDVVTNLYMMADEAPVWWADYPDPARRHPPAGMLDRCRATHTCPQILETFGSLEMYDEKMSPNLIGSTAQGDIPLPSNVHRYYFPATTHGGGAGGFTYVAAPAPAAGCTFPANPNPSSDTASALLDDFMALVMDGKPMPPSAYPTLRRRQLVPATQRAEGFPNIPGYPFEGDRINHPEKFNFGPRIDYFDQTGIVDIQPPIVERVLPAYAATVDGDGNEQAGVPSILLQAPLATYTGWNTYAAGIYKGQQCGLSASSYPFKETEAERVAAKDPRPSLEERYGTHAGYVCLVTAAAERGVARRVLRATAAQTLISQARAGNVLTDLAPNAVDQALGNRLCAHGRYD